MGRWRDREAASAAGLVGVGLPGTGLRFMVAAAGTGGISSTEGRLGRRGFCFGGVWWRPSMGDSMVYSSGSETSATEWRLV